MVTWCTFLAQTQETKKSTVKDFIIFSEEKKIIYVKLNFLAPRLKHFLHFTTPTIKFFFENKIFLEKTPL